MTPFDSESHTGNGADSTTDRTDHPVAGSEPTAGDPITDGGIEFETITVEYPETGVVNLVLDRPDDLNSLNRTVLDELDAAFDHVESDDAVTTLLLTGAGDAAFCGGADLDFMNEGLEPFEAVVGPCVGFVQHDDEPDRHVVFA